ncbi:hypothetical protein TL16_g08818 [Triparma laevis f. inornata]|uniref:type I protein arginine methyltransferase n=1 Tax=Triparma laevis f. inornata TaxID=1714386 RepID=A0A9W7AZE4_9STRA|nr:hypothetical protein TL16_g08818 [Triparma laevis f. inornata]
MSDSDCSEWSSDSEAGDFFASSFPPFSPSLKNTDPPTTLLASLSLDTENNFDLLSILHEILTVLSSTWIEPIKDDYVLIRLLNNLRTTPTYSSCLSLLPAPSSYSIEDNGPILQSGEIYNFQQSIYFKPVLEEDGYIFSVDTLREMYFERFGGDSTNLDVDFSPLETLSSLKAQLRASQNLIKTLTSETLPPPKPNTKSSAIIPPPSVDNDSYYFNSYSHYGIHETMLKDKIRTLAYKKSIEQNVSLFKGKTVLDVGCGTGVLSIFSKKLGEAKMVIGVDDSNMINNARKICQANGLSGEEIVLMRGKMEELELPVSKVDIVISEWMGYGLLYETMLPSVLNARDKYMSKDGTMWPNKCSMFMELGEDGRTEYWKDVYGIDMECMEGEIEGERWREARVEVVEENVIVSNRFNVWDCDLNIVKDEDLDFDTTFTLTVKNDQKINCFIISFDVDFDLPRHSKVSFSTSVQTTPTHWMQTLLWLEPSTVPEMKAGEVMKGDMRVERCRGNHRDIEFTIDWRVEGGEKRGKQKWAIVS